MFDRRWLLGAGLGAALLMAGCSSKDDRSAPTNEPGGSTATVDAAASPDASSPAVTAAPTPTPVLAPGITEDPCSIVTDDEMLTAVGGAVLTTAGIPGDSQPGCKWAINLEGQSEPAIFEVVIGSIANTSFFNPATEGSQDVTGIGDEAYAVLATGSGPTPGLTLWVLSGAKTLQVQVLPADAAGVADGSTAEAFNARALLVAEELAKLALPRT